MTQGDIQDKAVNRAYAILKENFKDVVIICSTPINDNKEVHCARWGNSSYACIGMCEALKNRLIDLVNEGLE